MKARDDMFSAPSSSPEKLGLRNEMIVLLQMWKDLTGHCSIDPTNVCEKRYFCKLDRKGRRLYHFLPEDF